MTDIENESESCILSQYRKRNISDVLKDMQEYCDVIQDITSDLILFLEQYPRKTKDCHDALDGLFRFKHIFADIDYLNRRGRELNNKVESVMDKIREDLTNQ